MRLPLLILRLSDFLWCTASALLFYIIIFFCFFCLFFFTPAALMISLYSPGMLACSFFIRTVVAVKVCSRMNIRTKVIEGYRERFDHQHKHRGNTVWSDVCEVDRSHSFYKESRRTPCRMDAAWRADVPSCAAHEACEHPIELSHDAAPNMN